MMLLASLSRCTHGRAPVGGTHRIALRLRWGAIRVLSLLTLPGAYLMSRSVLTLADYRPRERAFHLRQLERIAASLPRRGPVACDALQDKQEAPSRDGDEASTDHNTIAGCPGGCCLHATT